MMGFQAGLNVRADSNTFVGHNAGQVVTTGKSNTYFGANAGGANVTGKRNTFVGQNSGIGSVNSDDNVYIGLNTGGPDRGSRNTFLGNQSGVLLADAGRDEPLHNATAIGYGAKAAVSNVLILGQDASVGIGTSAPTSKLDVVADAPDESGLRLRQLTSASPAVGESDAFLSVNARGEVVKARYRARIGSVSEWSDRVFAPGYALRPLSSVAEFIGVHGHLPDVPSAERVVADGIDVAGMNALLLQKIEELTLYMIDLKKENQKQADQLQTVVQQNQQQSVQIQRLERKVR